MLRLATGLFDFIEQKIVQTMEALFNFVFCFQYSSSVTKYDRHGYKPRQRALLVTDKNVYLLDGKTFKTKHRLSHSSITEIVVTSETDSLLLVRIPAELKKDKVRIRHQVKGSGNEVGVGKIPIPILRFF